MRADFVGAIDADGDAAVINAELAKFIAHSRGEEDDQMVQLKRWD
jgi:hypothetical protein